MRPPTTEGSVVKVQETPGMTQGSKITTRDIKDIVRFTPTEQKIIGLLSDGLMHTSKELLGCLEGADDLSKTIVRQHIFRMRQKMELVGEYITCEAYYGKLYWRHVKLITVPGNGVSPLTISSGKNGNG